MQRLTARTAKELPLAERKRRLAAIAKDAPERVRAGLKLIDLEHVPTAEEKAYAEKLAPMARRALSRGARRTA